MCDLHAMVIQVLSYLSFCQYLCGNLLGTMSCATNMTMAIYWGLRVLLG